MRNAFCRSVHVMLAAVMAVALWSGMLARTGGAYAASPTPATSPLPVHMPVHVYKVHQKGSRFKTDAAPTNMRYGGGPLMASSQTYAIFWLPSGLHYESNAAGAAGDTNYENLIKRYFNDVGSTPFYNLLTQYSQPNQPINNASTLGGAWVDTRPYQHAATPPASFTGQIGSRTNPLIDGYSSDNTGDVGDIKAEVDHAIAANGWTTGLNKEFFVFTAAGIQSCGDDTTDPAKQQCSFNVYCAYHSAYKVTGTDIGHVTGGIIYSNMPDAYTLHTAPGDNATCGVQQPNGDPYADVAISGLSHEHFESVTDPVPNSGWWDPVSAPNDGGEIGDKCAYNYGPGVNPFNDAEAGNPAIYLQGHPYTIQTEWSNEITGCAFSHCPATRVCSTHLTLGADAQPLSISGGTSDDITYTLTVANNSDVDPATKLVLKDTLPSGLSFDGFSADPLPSSVDGNTLEWDFTAENIRTTGAITFHASPASALPGNTTLHNVATLDYDDSAGQAQAELTASKDVSVHGQVPGTPTYLTADSGDGTVNISFQPPADGGGNIDRYDVTVGTQTQQLDPATACSNSGGLIITCTTSQSGLTNGTGYHVSVSAHNGTGEGPAAVTTIIPGDPAQAPGAVENLASKDGDGQSVLSWNPPTSPAGVAVRDYGVTIYLSDGITPALDAVASPFSCDLTPSPMVCTSTVTGLTDGTQYVAQVTATNAAGATLTPSTVTLNPRPAPSRPSNLVLRASDREIDATWDATSDPTVDRWDISISDGTTTTTQTVSNVPAQSSPSAAFPNLVNGTQYTVSVQAHNAIGDGPALTAQATPFTVPDAPTITGTTGGPHSATVTFTPGFDEGSAIDRYDVQIGTADQKLDPASICKATASKLTGLSVHNAATVTCTATATGLTNGRVYDVAVTAHNAAGWSTAATASVTPEGPPGPVTNLKAVAGNGQGTVSWTDPVDDGGSAIDGHTVGVLIGRAPAPPPVAAGTPVCNNSTPATCSVALTNLTNETTYTVQVQAHNTAAGNGPAQSVALTPNAPPTLTVPVRQTAVYSEFIKPFTVQAADTDKRDALQLTASANCGTGTSTNCLPNGLSLSVAPPAGGTNSPIKGTVAGKVTSRAGTYTVTFTASDGHTAPVTKPVQIVVSPEKATLVPSAANPQLIALGAAGRTTGALTLKATIKGPADAAHAGTVAVTLAPIAGGNRVNCPAPVTAPAPGLTATCSTRGLATGVYEVVFSETGPYYTGRYNTVLTVSDPTWKAGGGSIKHGNLPADFGFLSRPNGLQGQMLFIEHRPAGDVLVVNGAVVSAQEEAAASGPFTGFRVSRVSISGEAATHGPYSATVKVTATSYGQTINDSSGKPVTDLTFNPAALTSGKIAI